MIRTVIKVVTVGYNKLNGNASFPRQLGPSMAELKVKRLLPYKICLNTVKFQLGKKLTN